MFCKKIVGDELFCKWRNCLPTSGTVVWWLSLLHNFIQLSLNSGSAQAQTLLAACRRFAMMRISDNGDKAKHLSSVNHTTKTIHHHHHRRFFLRTKFYADFFSTVIPLSQENVLQGLFQVWNFDVIAFIAEHSACFS